MNYKIARQLKSVVSEWRVVSVELSVRCGALGAVLGALYAVLRDRAEN